MAEKRGNKMVRRQTNNARARIEPRSLAALRKKVSTFSKELGKHRGKRIAIITLTLILIGAVGLRYKYFIVPASVNGQPIFFWEYFTKLHQIAGEQVLDQVITERLIKQQALREGVTVTKEQLAEEESKLEEQFAQAGGLQVVLVSQGITRQEFERQMRLGLLVRSILLKTASVSAQQVDQEYDDNKAQYENLQEDEAKRKIRETLENQHAQNEVTPWLENLKLNSRVEIYLPNR